MKASSHDLRERVLRAVDQGYQRTDIIKLFGVSRATIIRIRVLSDRMKTNWEERRRQCVMGTRVTRAASHVPLEEVKRRMARDPRFWVRQRWWIIYKALIAPRKAEESAQHTGVSVTTVRRVISGYNRLGLVAIETPGKGGRRHEYLTVEQERQLLSPFFARAQSGEIATVGEIKGL